MRVVELRYEVQILHVGLSRPLWLEEYRRAVGGAPAFGSDKFGLFDDRAKAKAFAEYLGTSGTIINEVEVLPHNNGEPT
jgi:hypothetical protein